MGALLWLVVTVIDIYIWVLIISVIMTWLIAFNVINTSNRFVYMVVDFLYSVTDPVLRPIRNLLPNMGGIDISPVIVILILLFVQRAIVFGL